MLRTRTVVPLKPIMARTMATASKEKLFDKILVSKMKKKKGPLFMDGGKFLIKKEF